MLTWNISAHCDLCFFTCMAQYVSSAVELRTSSEVTPLLPHHSVEEEVLIPDDSADTVRADFSGAEFMKNKRLERGLLRKLDAKLSILVLIYVLNYIDRNNVAAARLHGFEEDLHLTGSQFATVLSILYIGYIILQIPSNMTLNYFGKPSLYLPGCMAVWGIMSCLTGTATTYFGALCTRFFLGFVEAAFFPGALASIMLSKCYKRNELSQRTAYLSSGSLIASATGSLIASGILSIMDNTLGIATWRWLFFIEGGLTVFVALCAAFILPDFPENSSGWLTPAERTLAMQRIQDENPPAIPSNHNQLKTQLDGLYSAMRDPKVWWLAASLGSLTFSLSWNAYFPSIMATIGYNSTVTLLLCAPPWFVATAIAIVVSRHSDKVGERCWHITFSMGIGIIGFTLARSTMNAVIRCISLFFIAQSYTGHICFLARASGSVSQTPTKRAVALALMNTVGSLGNVFGLYIWPTKWGPGYNNSLLQVCLWTFIWNIWY
ncbi:major facilitator superfamily domain-containing protein [Lentinula aciculospora]|uniref:Major facilitator superfamily domain-containing protein n=1 Tax=Lentinula aciculospora TaxID=153920 RepID=A0A9W9AA20_9AGAR|nr:major facilitator superfamily domain-containing protein [Lentinula aciculospora]